MNFSMKCFKSSMIRTLLIVKMIIEILWFSTDLLWKIDPGMSMKRPRADHWKHFGLTFHYSFRPCYQEKIKNNTTSTILVFYKVISLISGTRRDNYDSDI